MLHWPVTAAKRSLHTYLNITHSPLPPALRREVLRATLALDRSRIDNSGTLDFLGYKIAYSGEQSVRYLIEEIFGKAAYFFESDTDAPTILDCGSNIGMSVLFFKKLYPKANIMAFEPDPATFAVLMQNIQANDLNAVSAYQVALGAHGGQATFNRHVDDSTSSLTMSLNPERHSGRQISVDVRRLSEFIDAPVDLLKIDIEGAETEVLPELQASGKLALIRNIHMEYHHHVGSARDNLSTMFRLLEDAGFGYQIAGDPGPWSKTGCFQDVSLYCYRI